MRPLLTLLLALGSCLAAMAYDAPVQARHDSILAHITGAAQLRAGATAQPERSILSFGAKVGGERDCLPAFQKAMRWAAKSKQGLHLVVPAGDYLLKGPIHLVSNVTLDLQEGARLVFDRDARHYLPGVRTSWEATFCQNYSPFIYGFQLHDVAIIGQGIIDGNAHDIAAWRADQRPDQQASRDMNHQEVPIDQRDFAAEGHKLRPQLIQLFGCKDVTLQGVFITNSPFWCVHLLKCQNVICRDLRYDAKLVNNDGIDPEMTRDLLIEGIQFNNGDDNVAIKAGRDNDGWDDNAAIAPAGLEELYRPCPSENIIIRRCSFKGLHGVVVGSEMSAGVQNVFVEDCTYGGYNKRALYVKTNPNRGGFVRHIYFQNCEFGDVEDMFYITSMYAGEGADDNHFTDIHDIHVRDVRCQSASNAAIVLQGTTAKPLRNISFEHLHVEKAAIGFSAVNTEGIILKNCTLGGRVDSAPSTVTKHDRIFERDTK